MTLFYCRAAYCKKRGHAFRSLGDLRKHQQFCLPRPQSIPHARQAVPFEADRPALAEQVQPTEAGAQPLHAAQADGVGDDLDFGADGDVDDHDIGGDGIGAAARGLLTVHSAANSGRALEIEDDSEPDWSCLAPFEPIDIFVAGLHDIPSGAAQRVMRCMAFQNLHTLSFVGANAVNSGAQELPPMSAVLNRITRLIDIYGTSFVMVEVPLPSRYGNLQAIRFPLRELVDVLNALFSKARILREGDIQFEPMQRTAGRVHSHSQSDLFAAAYEVRDACIERTDGLLDLVVLASSRLQAGSLQGARRLCRCCTMIAATLLPHHACHAR